MQTVSTRRLPLAISLLSWCVCLAAAPSYAQSTERTGEELYRSACVSCHGPDGKGQLRSVVGFDTELPDFTSCGFTTPEADGDWSAVIHKGGTIRALSRRMPSFVDALKDEEIDRIIDYIRGFCREPGWPR